MIYLVTATINLMRFAFQTFKVLKCHAQSNLKVFFFSSHLASTMALGKTAVE
jgi:uncharacterized protein with PQ loop repeat